MVKRSPQDSEETLTPQASEQDNRELNKIGAATAFDFSGKNLTPNSGPGGRRFKSSTDIEPSFKHQRVVDCILQILL
jgi:hypothetical protein